MRLRLHFRLMFIKKSYRIASKRYMKNNLGFSFIFLQFSSPGGACRPGFARETERASAKSCDSHLLSATAMDYLLFSLFLSLLLSLSLSCSLLFALLARYRATRTFYPRGHWITDYSLFLSLSSSLSLSLLLSPFRSFSAKSCDSHLLSARALDY